MQGPLVSHSTRQHRGKKGRSGQSDPDWGKEGSSYYRTNEIWHKYHKEADVCQDKEEADQRDHVRSEP